MGGQDMSLSTGQYLALSEAAYADLKTAFDNNPNPSIPLTIADLIGSVLDTEEKPQLAAISEISDWKLIAVKEVASDPYNYAAGFSAAAFMSPTGEIVFTFCGSNDYLDWLSTDLAIAKASSLNDAAMGQFSVAEEFVFDTLNEYGSFSYPTLATMYASLTDASDVSFTGHSLGGRSRTVSNL
jgi:hypothetical protein